VETQHFNTIGTEVAGEETGFEGGSDTGDEFDGFEGGEGAGDAGYGAEDGEASGPGGAGKGIEAAETAGFAGDERSQVEIEVMDGGLDHGSAEGHGVVIEEIPFGEEGSAIDDDIGLGDETGGVVGCDVVGFGDDIEAWVEGLETGDGAVDAGFPDVIVGHQELSIEVGVPEKAAMGEDEATDASGGEFEGDHAAETTDAGDEDGGGLETALGGGAEAGDIGLPFVGGDFLRGQFGQEMIRGGGDGIRFGHR
jgi:hypothetical protein